MIGALPQQCILDCSNKLSQYRKGDGEDGLCFGDFSYSEALLRFFAACEMVPPFCIFRLHGSCAAELDICNVNKDRNLLEHGLHSFGVLLGHADVRTTVANYIHMADMLQKAFLDFYERDHHLLLSYRQAIHLTGYSQTAIYKRFPSSSSRRAA
jgi:hypothetical protein